MKCYYLKLLTLLMVFSFGFQGFTQPVSKSGVIQMADNFLYSRMKLAGYNQEPGEPETIHHWTQNNNLVGYIINYQEGGWILTTADFRFYPVLAYAFSGQFNLADIPPGCQSWIDHYANQITNASAENGEYEKEMAKTWNDYLDHRFDGSESSMVEPLTRSVWDQLGYHNHMCPADPEGINGFVPVGCVPLAMAQLMYYYRFPESGIGSVIYTPSYQSGIYGPQYANFGSTVYNWNNMADQCREENNAVAELCYHAGVSLEVSYMPESTGSNINKIPDAITNHFKYTCDEYLMRSDVSGTTAWVSLLIDNLNSRQPIIYRSTAGFSGHVYLCDGYQDSTHFHFNWGWGGTYNGYYYIDDLTPGGIQISYVQGAVLNIYPDTSQYAYPATQDFTVLTNNVGSLEDGSGPENYADDFTASWLIQPQDTSITNIMLVFSRLDTELENDLIKIYSGPDTTAPLVKTYSGQDIPTPYYASGPELLITFQSNGDVNGNGFHLNYYGYHLPFCGETVVLTDSVGKLEDGSSYHNYQNNADCSWLIAPEIYPFDSISQISLLPYHVEVAHGDTLFIYEGENNQCPLIGKFWQENPPTELISNDNKVFVEFKTDDSQKAQGWGFFWEYLPPEYCSDTLIFGEYSGQVSDGSGEKRYVSNSNCFYLIDVPEAESISLEFLEFETEENYDYLKIYDADQPNIPLIKLSGSEIPTDLTWPLNKLLLEFYSDDRQNYQGFKLNYSASIPGFAELEDDLSIYPNPVLNHLIMHSNSLAVSGAAVQICRMDAQVVYSGILQAPHHMIDVHTLPPGIYIVNIQHDDWSITKKIVKN